jgi:tetratricopeptide (TPR) repeat protein
MAEVNAHLISRSTLELLAKARAAAGADRAVIDRALSASHLANRGQLAQAKIELEAAIGASDDLAVLFTGFQFFFRTGELERAEVLVRKRLALAEQREDQEQIARACTNLGTLLLVANRAQESRGYLEHAVSIDESRNDLRALARDIGNLANYFEHVDELDQAEQLNRRALAMAQELGDIELAAGRMANLGDIADAGGHGAEARTLWKAAAEHFASLGLSHYAHQYERKLAQGNPSKEPR